MGIIMKKESSYTLAWRKRNTDKHREYQRKYRQTPQYKEYRKKYREQHRQEFAQKQQVRNIKKRQKILDDKHDILEALRSQALQKKVLSDNENMALIAGLILGEGTIGLYPSRKTLYPRVSVTNTEVELLTIIKDFLGGHYTFSSAKGNRKKRYTLTISGRDAVFNALIKTYPLLIGKKRQIAEFLMEWIISRSCRVVVGKEFITPRENELYEEIRRLNQRGNTL